MSSQKKITPVYNSTPESGSAGKKTSALHTLDKPKAKKLRIFPFLSWFVAIGLEVVAYFVLQDTPINFTLLTILIVCILLFAVLGSYLWKKANRLDPASVKNKVKFFVQNQLGVIMSILAFAPLIVLIFMNKDMDKKQKGIFGGIVTLALIIAGVSGADFNPPSIEQYTEQTELVKSLNGGENHVFGRNQEKVTTCFQIVPISIQIVPMKYLKVRSCNLEH
ncbi:hypothetical protein N9569_04195 [Flavobacteriaceae bacterium]|nr:hypothetical protein [Flavobacteriaceae bacterium]MDB4129582.1 hypothetical protein [Flavobacteriaceae bacterium]